MPAVNVTSATELPPVWDDCSVQAAASVNPTWPDGSMTTITDPAGYTGALQADVHTQIEQHGSVNEVSL